MSVRVKLEDVTSELVRNCGRIYVTDEPRFALLSKDRLLPRFRASRAEGGMSPPELQVIVDELTQDAFNDVARTVRGLDATRTIEEFTTSFKPGSFD